MDTASWAEELQLQRWREMSSLEKAQLADELCATVERLARIGIRQRHPEATPRELFLRLAILRLGRDLAVRAYPEARELEGY